LLLGEVLDAVVVVVVVTVTVGPNLSALVTVNLAS